MKCIEVSNVNYDQFERLAKRYEMSTPRLMGAIIDFFKELPISPVESDLVHSMIHFFAETGINPLESGEDLGLIMMKRVLDELKGISSNATYNANYGSARQELKLESIEARTKALAGAVENITYLIRSQQGAAAHAAPALPPVDTKKLFREIMDSFIGSKSVSVLMGDDPMDTLTNQAVELTRSHLQAAHALYRQELPAKRGWFNWFSKRNDAGERDHIMELARQLHENEAKQLLAGRVSGAFIDLSDKTQPANVPDDTLGHEGFAIIDTDNDFFSSFPEGSTVAVDSDDDEAEVITRWEEPPGVWDFAEPLEEDLSISLADLLATRNDCTERADLSQSTTDSQVENV